MHEDRLDDFTLNQKLRKTFRVSSYIIVLHYWYQVRLEFASLGEERMLYSFAGGETSTEGESS